MTDEQKPSARTNVACEPEPLPIDAYTPMTKEEWDRGMEIYDSVLESVGIGEKKSE